jgi:hypothetical protein
VNYSDSSYTPPSLNKENGSKAFVTPSKDCSSVRVWIYTAGRDGLALAPSDSQCNKPHAKSSDSSGLVQCADFPVYKSEKDSAGMQFPLAYLKNGALVTRESASGAGALSGIYFQKIGSANQVTEMSHTSTPQGYLAGSYPGTIRVAPADQSSQHDESVGMNPSSGGSYPGTGSPIGLDQPRKPAGNRSTNQ